MPTDSARLFLPISLFFFIPTPFFDSKTLLFLTSIHEFLPPTSRIGQVLTHVKDEYAEAEAWLKAYFAELD